MSAGAHVGDRVYPIAYRSDEMLERIDLQDGSVDEWYELVGEPAITLLDFTKDYEDGSPLDPADLDFRIDYTERLVRAEIASWPDGTHTFTDYLDSNGVGGPRVKLQVTITVEGDSLTADFRGTDPQAPGAINNSLSFTASVATLCVRSVFREEIPNTAGMFRPIRIVTEPGTVVHGVMPAASSMRGITGFRLVDTMFGDVGNGKVSLQSARREYGVVLDDGFEVLEEETDRLRSEIRASRG